MMKFRLSILCCTVLGLGVQSVLANPITVNVTAHVTSVTDSSSGVLGGQILVGEVITGTYTYDTSMPNVPSNGWGVYYPTTQLPASASVTAGALVFQGVVSGSPITVHVGTPTPETPNFYISASGVRSSIPYTALSINFDFEDNTGTFPGSTALPTGAPSLPSLANSHISVFGTQSGSTTYTYWSFSAQIDSVQLVPPAFEVIPAAGDILPQQHFDAALLLSPGVHVTSMQASVAGNPLPLSYPGTCQLVAPNSAGRPAILCPNAQTVLPAAGGVTQILWQVGLADGTQLSQTVQWTVTP